MNVVSEVTNKDLCISCRACAQVCPHDIITFKHIDGLFHPSIDIDKCTNCGLCTKVCPSYKNSLAEYNSENIFVGKYTNIFTAYCKDDSLREVGSSGGMITSLIVKLISQGYYKKAAVVLYDKYNEQADYTITDSIEDIIAAAKSKYVPVSTTKVLEYIKQGNSDSLIVVATPCQIYAIKSYCNLKKHDLSNVLFLGLFCEHTLNYNIYNYYTESYGDYDALYFRSKYQDGWPGHTVLKQGDDHKIVNRSVRMSLKPYFKNNRCRYCFDKLNSRADISFGDCYVKGLESIKGNSSIIIRTKKGEDAINYVKDQFSFTESKIEEIKISQHINKLINNYSRAIANNNQMYSDYPAVEPISLNSGENERGYTKLRVGACAETKNDYKYICSIIRPKPHVVIILRRIAKTLKNKL